MADQVRQGCTGTVPDSSAAANPERFANTAGRRHAADPVVRHNPMNQP